MKQLKGKHGPTPHATSTPARLTGHAWTTLSPRLALMDPNGIMNPYKFLP